MQAANKCFFGTNVMKDDACSADGTPFLIFLFFIVFNITYNMVRPLPNPWRSMRLLTVPVGCARPYVRYLTHASAAHACGVQVWILCAFRHRFGRSTAPG